MVKEESYIGYLKYSGTLVEDGLLDAKKSAQALIGFDDAVRFFAAQLSPELKDLDYELPVRVRKGSWEILLPQTIGEWILAGGGVIGTAYLTTAATKLAEKDFENIGTKDVFIKALRAIQWMIKIGKHVGDLTIKQFDKVEWRNNNDEIGIRNSKNEVLFVHKELLKLYVITNPKLLSKVAELVEEERSLSIGVRVNGGFHEETITRKVKHVFTLKEDDIEDIIFPELTHGSIVTLEGKLTRGNETSNTIGFKYHDHILTCYPNHGSIVKFKRNLFLRSRVYGTISRLDDHGGLTAKKPKIIIDHIEPIADPNNSLKLDE